jgi:hypothetical protein
MRSMKAVLICHPWSQHLLDSFHATEDDPVVHTDDASTPILFDHLGIERLR